MRKVNVNVLSHASNASVNGSQIDSNQLVSASFHAVFTGGDEAGTLKIQASNDIYQDQYQPSNFTVTNWVDIPNATASITSGDSVLITITNCSYRWLRAVYTRSGGGASDKTINVNLFALSV